MTIPSSPNVFVSYSRLDVRFVQAVVQLMEVAGANVWVDTRQLKFGERWSEEIRGAIARSDRVVVFWTANAAASAEVQNEIETAKEFGKVIVPISATGIALPVGLREFHGVANLRSSLQELRSHVNSGTPMAPLGQKFLGDLFADPPL